MQNEYGEKIIEQNRSTNRLNQIRWKHCILTALVFVGLIVFAFYFPSSGASVLGTSFGCLFANLDVIGNFFKRIEKSVIKAALYR
jgi:hypothetical protein